MKASLKGRAEPLPGMSQLQAMTSELLRVLPSQVTMKAQLRTCKRLWRVRFWSQQNGLSCHELRSKFVIESPGSPWIRTSYNFYTVPFKKFWAWCVWNALCLLQLQQACCRTDPNESWKLCNSKVCKTRASWAGVVVLGHDVAYFWGPGRSLIASTTIYTYYLGVYTHAY